MFFFQTAINSIFFSFVLLAGSLCAEEIETKTEKEFIVLRCRDDDIGMFSIFNDVLSLLHCYEQGLYKGVKVDFDTAGVYYDPSHGPNWWEYYCKPICLGEENNAKIHEVNGFGIPFAIPREELRSYPRKNAYKLIQKYIFPKPHILEIIKKFEKKHFKHRFIIGVHYRGTDKILEALRVSFNKVKTEISKLLKELKGLKYKIYVATDEEEFLKFMESEFQDKICYYEAATRSEDKTPVHKSIKANVSPYKIGEDAFIDCLLLSKTDFLIRTSSNLSQWSTYFNPDIPVAHLSQTYVP